MKKETQYLNRKKKMAIEISKTAGSIVSNSAIAMKARRAKKKISPHYEEET